MATTKEILKALQAEKRSIQSKKGPLGYTMRQSFDLIQIQDKIREYKRISTKK